MNFIIGIDCLGMSLGYGNNGVCGSGIELALEFVVRLWTLYCNTWSTGHGLSTGIWSAGHGLRIGIWSAGHGLSVGICGLQGTLYWSSWCEHGLSIGVYGPGMDSESVI